MHQTVKEIILLRPLQLMKDVLKNRNWRWSLIHIGEKKKLGYFLIAAVF